MTDNRTTELLREGLTEHGIEWRSGLKGVTFVGDWCFVEYDNGKLAATCEPVLTPEQAIAATLGNPINEATGKPFDFNKLANRLNGDKDATLGSGTCEYVIEDNMNESEGMGDVWFRCTNCNTCYDYYADDWLLKMPYCPNCGAKVIQGVDNAD